MQVWRGAHGPPVLLLPVDCSGGAHVIMQCGSRVVLPVTQQLCQGLCTVLPAVAQLLETYFVRQPHTLQSGPLVRRVGHMALEVAADVALPSDVLAQCLLTSLALSAPSLCLTTGQVLHTHTKTRHLGHATTKSGLNQVVRLR